MAEGNYTCSGSTPEELEFEAIFDYWSEGVVNLAICCVGVVANCVSIPVLCSKVQMCPSKGFIASLESMKR